MAKSSKSSVAEAPYRYKSTEEKRSGWDDYEIRDALSTLVKAGKIRKNSALMRAIRTEAAKQVAAAKSTASNL